MLLVLIVIENIKEKTLNTHFPQEKCISQNKKCIYLLYLCSPICELTGHNFLMKILSGRQCKCEWLIKNDEE